MRKKVKISVGIDQEFLEIIQKEIERHKFSSVSHAVNWSLEKTLKRNAKTKKI